MQQIFAFFMLIVPVALFWKLMSSFYKSLRHPKKSLPRAMG